MSEKKNDGYNFFALLSRMKYINRWGLMRNTVDENIAEHSLDVGIIAHALAVIKNTYFDGCLNPEKAAVYAMFHDTPEIITGDLPTPVKYFEPKIKKAYDQVEEAAIEKLVNSLPEELRETYIDLIDEKKRDEEYHRIVKAADKISALVKCMEEKKMGNSDFVKAEQEISNYLKKLNQQEVDFFLDKFLDAYGLTLDELTE